jgi:tryptophanyl-tRNA synthetase
MLTDPEKNIKQEKKINQTKIYKFKITSSGNNDKSKLFQISKKFTSSESQKYSISEKMQVSTFFRVYTKTQVQKLLSSNYFQSPRKTYSSGNNCKSQLFCEFCKILQGWKK